MPSADFLFHDILHVRLNYGRGALMRPLLSRYAAYRSEASSEPDLTFNLGPFTEDMSGAFRVDDRIFVKEGSLSCVNRYKIARWKFSIKGLDGKPMVVNIDANGPAHMVIAGDTVPAMIRLGLARKGAVLAHGSAVEKDGRAIVFSGRSGAGKTITAARFLARGWRHLGDDSCILHQGRVFSFIQPLTVRFTYDVNALFRNPFTLRERAIILAKECLSLATARRINLLTNLPPERALGGALGTSGKCTHLVILRSGDSFLVEKGFSREAAVDQVIANIRFESRELDAYLQAYTHVFPHSPLVRFWEDQAASLLLSLEGSEAVRITVPKTYTDGAFAGILHAVGGT